MALPMLSEHRRKKTPGILFPRKSLWSEDKGKFGQRMLEKMGWAEGKGLGKNEQGIHENIPLSLKFNSEGLGYDKVTKERENLWMTHCYEYENILSALNEEHNKHSLIEKPLDTEDLKSSSKVENKIRYQKMVKKSDLSTLNSIDIASVLGTRRLKCHVKSSFEHLKTAEITSSDKSKCRKFEEEETITVCNDALLGDFTNAEKELCSSRKKKKREG